MQPGITRSVACGCLAREQIFCVLASPPMGDGQGLAILTNRLMARDGIPPQKDACTRALPNGPTSQRADFSASGDEARRGTLADVPSRDRLGRRPIGLFARNQHLPGGAPFASAGGRLHLGNPESPEILATMAAAPLSPFGHHGVFPPERPGGRGSLRVFALLQPAATGRFKKGEDRRRSRSSRECPHFRPDHPP